MIPSYGTQLSDRPKSAQKELESTGTTLGIPA